MEHRECLTNELLQKRFKSQFDLVLYAIKIAENRVKSGHDDLHDLDTENLATEILDEIAEGRDTFENIIQAADDDEEEDEEEVQPVVKAKGKKKVKV